MERKLEEFVTIGEVTVSRSLFPSASGGGWGSVAVDDGTPGGYEWQIYFVKNLGETEGFTYPPSSGNIDSISTNTELIEGTNVKTQTIVYKDGSNPIDGTFKVAFDGVESDEIRYDQSEMLLEYKMESMSNVGDVTVSSTQRLMAEVPYVRVNVTQDVDTISVDYTSTLGVCGQDEVCKPDLRHFLAPGELIRIGTEDSTSTTGNTAMDGAEYFTNVIASAESPIIYPVTGNLPIIYPGEELRIGGDIYEVLSGGFEKQILSFDCLDATSECGNFRLKFTNRGLTQTTECIRRPASGSVPTAEWLASQFDSLDNVAPGDVVVTQSNDNYAYAYNIYFSGESVRGDMKSLVIEKDCTSYTLEPFNLNPTIFTAVNGGFTETQNIRLNVASGYVDGTFFKLTVNSVDTPCMDFGAESNVVAGHLSTIFAYETLSTIKANITTIVTPSTLTLNEDFKGANLVVSDLGEPDKKFEVIRGKSLGFNFVNFEFLTKFIQSQANNKQNS